ncbi:MAG: PIN domain-containing protein [Solirubrobacteraceae bacterium]
MTFPGGLLLADKSAWERAADARVREEWTEALVSGRIVTCLPVRYELLFSARDAESFVALEGRLAALRDVALTASVQRAAMAAQRDLAELGPLHHRVPLPDLLIATVAQEHGLVVVHEDRHFETLQRVLSFTAHRLLAD